MSDERKNRQWQLAVSGMIIFAIAGVIITALAYLFNTENLLIVAIVLFGLSLVCNFVSGPITAE